MASSGEAPECAWHSGEQTEAGPPADLSHAGAVVDKAIEYMSGQHISDLAIASALLGGAIGILSRSLGEQAIINVLDNAIASVRAGELRHIDGSSRA